MQPPDAKDDEGDRPRAPWYLTVAFLVVLHFAIAIAIHWVFQLGGLSSLHLLNWHVLLMVSGTILAAGALLSYRTGFVSRSIKRSKRVHYFFVSLTYIAVVGGLVVAIVGKIGHVSAEPYSSSPHAQVGIVAVALLLAQVALGVWAGVLNTRRSTSALRSTVCRWHSFWGKSTFATLLAACLMGIQDLASKLTMVDHISTSSSEYMRAKLLALALLATGLVVFWHFNLDPYVPITPPHPTPTQEGPLEESLLAPSTVTPDV